MNFIFIHILLLKINVIFSNKKRSNIQNLKKNLIIGAVINYKWKKVAPFIKSYKMSGIKNCDCILFISNMPTDTINKIKSFGIIVYNIPKYYRNKKIINYRWKLYKDFLISNSYKYNLVMAVDVKDVFFQKDPFQYYIGKKSFLGVAIEDGTLSKGINKKWVIKAYGWKLHREIKEKRIICVGTVWGTIDKFIEFSGKMWQILNSRWSFRHRVIEQAVGNFIIYHDKMFKDCLVTSENDDGPIMTIGTRKRKEIYFDLNDNILNKKGEVASVVHQYNRVPAIFRKEFNKYCSDLLENKVNNYFLRILFFIFIIFILIKLFYFFI